MTYQLKKDVSESFDFEIGENKYTMRYLNGEQRKKLADISQTANKLEAKAQKATDDGDDKALDKLKVEGDKIGKDMSSFLDSLIKPAEGSEPIRDVLDREIAPVIRNFQEMLRIEQSLEAQPNVRPKLNG